MRVFFFSRLSSRRPPLLKTLLDSAVTSLSCALENTPLRGEELVLGGLLWRRLGAASTASSSLLGVLNVPGLMISKPELTLRRTCEGQPDSNV